MSRSRTPEHLPAPVDICGFGVRPVNRDQLIHALIERARRRIRTRAHYLNTHTFNLSLRDADFREILATADLLYADGMSVVWAGRWLGRPLPERLSAADYFEVFCRECARGGVRLFFLGGLEGVAQTAASVMTSRIPALRVVGSAIGHFHDRDCAALVERINAADPELLVVGMGSPRQETWVARHAAELTVPVCWTVGALFDYFAGREPRAPAWLCRHGGEWIYRLLHQPRERWQRYLVGNTRFAWAVLRARLNGNRHPPKTARGVVRQRG